MIELALYLLGPARIELHGKPIELKQRKVLALFAYLATTAQRQSRDVLAELLYPKQDRIRARSGLRQTLSILRSHIGDGWLSADRGGVALLADGLWVDAGEFCRLAATQAQPEDLGLLAKAVGLYRGDFLDGFFLKDSRVF